MKRQLSDIRYTKGNVRDIDTCMELVQSLPDFFTKKSHGEIKKSLTQDTFFTAQNAHTLLGFCCIKKKDRAVYEILWLAVDTKMQRKKIGTTLVHKVLDYMEKRGARYVFVKTLARTRKNDTYKAARKFYEGLGFTLLISVDPFPSWDAGNPCALYVKNISTH